MDSPLAATDFRVSHSGTLMPMPAAARTCLYQRPYLNSKSDFLTRTVCTVAPKQADLGVLRRPGPAAGLKRHISITMELASRTISPVPDISRYGTDDGWLRGIQVKFSWPLELQALQCSATGCQRIRSQAPGPCK